MCKVPPEAAIARKDTVFYLRLNPKFSKLSHLPQYLARVRVSEIHPIDSEPGENIFSLRRHRYEQVSPVKTGMEKFILNSVLSYIINYLYLQMKVSYLLVVAVSKRMCGLVWTEGWE